MNNILEILLNSDLSKEDLKTVIDGFIAGESLKLVKTSKTEELIDKTADRVGKRQARRSYARFSKMDDDKLTAQFKEYCRNKPDAFDRVESFPSYCKREMIRRKIIGEDIT